MKKTQGGNTINLKSTRRQKIWKIGKEREKGGGGRGLEGEEEVESTDCLISNGKWDKTQQDNKTNLKSIRRQRALSLGYSFAFFIFAEEAQYNLARNVQT